MPPLDWDAFRSLPGNESQNFEDLCRALIRLYFGQYGKFQSLKNQPGVEFHLRLMNECVALGNPPRWYGWQCKFHKRTAAGDLTSASRQDIKDSLKKTEKYLPDITDWVLWTPYTLSKKDQKWFDALQTKFTLHQWVEKELDTYLAGPGLLLRSTYFGELILTPDELDKRHREAIQPIKDRWLVPVHQSVDAERIVRRMLGEPGSWGQMVELGNDLAKAVDVIVEGVTKQEPGFDTIITPLISACNTFIDTLLNLHDTLANGDLGSIRQKLIERKTLIDAQVCAVPRQLRMKNLPCALEATNALDDLQTAQNVLDEIEEFISVGIVAILADAGAGKTQMAAQLTATQGNRPAGVFLHGKDFHRGQSLDDLAQRFSIAGNPVGSMERLLAALDAAGKRAKCRLPIVIDGLNEAENPRDWKASLASLTEAIKHYPNVLVVCTMRTGEHRRDDYTRAQSRHQANTRESFAIMALPDEVRKIETEGFGGDTDAAIEKYFEYFKINPGDAEIPVDFLQHPLTLRIYCEVTNPKRESVVDVAYFPASLSPLFERYVSNACERISQMPNLSYTFSLDEVIQSVHIFGLQLWADKQAMVSDSHFRETVRDSTRSWESSIVNLLAQEGILFRNPGQDPKQFVLTATYDPLGGYIVAKSLIDKYGNGLFEWLDSSEAESMFSGDQVHRLALDVFKSLVTLTPRCFNGEQLWKRLGNGYKYAALAYITELEAEYLDQDTVTAFSELLLENPKDIPRLYSRLQAIRGLASHPLNADFLDSVLQAMNVPLRDLTWTEWIRKTRSERINDLITMELRWKNELTMRTQSDQLHAKWIKWLLTSTDHALRDVTTRALYWFGRGDPKGLFEQSIASLEINDPYVPERVLAAAYGVAMALHVDMSDHVFRTTTLPEYARRLYDLIFAEGATYGTSHILTQYYATKTIELAELHNTGLFSREELKKSTPPFLEGPFKKWSESKLPEEDYKGPDSPFRMDFENYTIGHLVPDRRNYDYTDSEYKKIRSQILWRVEQLGWSSELFKDIDKSIEIEQRHPRVDDDRNRIDRYGKKYSWIAYFEMVGHLRDQGILERPIEDIIPQSIDPSFPERDTKEHIIDADLLGDPSMDIKDWIIDGPLPTLNPYLRVREISGLEGPWIMLDGFIVQEDEGRGRKSFCFIRSFLISKQEANIISKHLQQQDLSGRWLPEKPDIYYLYAGEIPWCSSFPNNGKVEFSFLIKETPVKVKKLQQTLYLDDRKLISDHNDSTNPIRKIENDKHYRKLIKENIEGIEIREEMVEVEEIQKEYKSFEAMIPVCDFHLLNNQTITTLAKEIAADLGLIGKPQTFDLYTREDEKATFNVSDHSDEYNNQQSMLFIKEDLLKTYLEKFDLAFIWTLWGERSYSTKQIIKLFHRSTQTAQSYATFSIAKPYQ